MPKIHDFFTENKSEQTGVDPDQTAIFGIQSADFGHVKSQFQI